MKKIIFLFFFLYSTIIFAQAINNSAVMSISSGSEISNISSLNFSGKIENEGVIKINGNFTNNGAFTSIAGNTIFNGTSILDGTTTLTIFNNLTIDTTLNIVVNKQVTINGTLTNNGTLTLKSDTTGTASLIDNGISGLGIYNVEQFITGNRWWYISSPVSNDTSDVYNAVDIVNNGIFSWNEVGNVWVRITNNTTVLTPFVGYSTKFKNVISRTNIYQGIINTGVFTLPITYTVYGWTLFGNPYPSAIDWNAATGWTKTNIINTIWYRANGTYATYNGNSFIGTNGGQQYIPAMQSFWIRGNNLGAASLSVNNAARVHNGQPLYRITPPTDIVRMTISNGTYSDESVIAFMNDATDVFDDYDSEKKFSDDVNYPQICTYNNKISTIDTRKYPTTEVSIPIYFKTSKSGNFTLSFNISMNNYDIYLEDTKAKSLTDLKVSSTYFFVSGIVYEPRFNLKFVPKNILPIKLLNYDLSIKDNLVFLNWETSSEENNDFFTIEKSKDGYDYNFVGLIKGSGNSNVNNTYYIIDYEPYIGISYYRLTQTDYDGKTESYKPLVLNNIKYDGIIIFPNPSEDYINIVLNNECYILYLYDNIGRKIYEDVINNNNYKLNMNKFNKGEYNLVIKDSNNIIVKNSKIIFF